MFTLRALSVLVFLLVLIAPESVMAESWKYSEQKDPITDATKAMAVLTNDSGGVAVKCDKNGSNVMYLQVVSKSYLTTEESLSVAMRIDGGPIVEKFWLGRGRSVMLLPWDGAAMDAKSLASAKRIVFRITKENDSDIDIVLDADGDGAAVKRAFATCGQDYPQ